MFSEETAYWERFWRKTAGENTWEEDQERRCWTGWWKKAIKPEATADWREMHKTETYGAVINRTCLWQRTKREDSFWCILMHFGAIKLCFCHQFCTHTSIYYEWPNCNIRSCSKVPKLHNILLHLTSYIHLTLTSSMEFCVKCQISLKILISLPCWMLMILEKYWAL